MATRELQVINAVLKNKDIGILFAGGAVNDLFEAYGDVWRSIQNYHAKYRSVPDFDVIRERHNIEYIETSAATEYYLDALREEVIKNKTDNILTAASIAMNKNGDTGTRVLAKLQTELGKLNRFSAASSDLNIMDFDAAEAHYADVRAKAAANGGVPGIPTGISFIDSAYPSGLAGGDLVIILGWTGRAKSLFSTLIACNAHDKGRKPMIASLEMPAEKLRDRVYTIKGSGLFSNSSLTLGDIGTDDFRSFRNKHSNSPEFMVLTHDGLGEFTPNAGQAKIDEHKPSMFILDYSQLGSDNANSGDMTARMRNMSKEWKKTAVLNDIPVILISSATPDGAASTREPPTIEQVAWSKQLAYDADLAFAVHRRDDSDYIDIVCRKNRNGPQFAGGLDWDIDNGIIKEVFDI